MERNYLDKHDALNKTADALTRAGIGVVCAKTCIKRVSEKKPGFSKARFFL